VLIVECKVSSTVARFLVGLRGRTSRPSLLKSNDSICGSSCCNWGYNTVDCSTVVRIASVCRVSLHA
jgi:hypothetical protein